MNSFLSLVPVEGFRERYAEDITPETYFGFPIAPLIEAERRLMNPATRSVAYFSMEFGLSCNTYNAFDAKRPVDDSNFSHEHGVFSNLRAIDYYVTLRTDHRLDLPIYSGGLGVLAGDTLKSAADRAVSLVGVGILWNKGYFKQNFWFKDGQVPEENIWDPGSFPGLVPLERRIEVPFRNETVHLRLWKYFVYSYDKSHVVPLVLLDSNIGENSEFERRLTDQLYRSDNAEWKLLQRAILGLGGMKALRALGYSIDLHHLNEGHAALAFVEKAKGVPANALAGLAEKFAYTCHTPVIAGHDRFHKRVLAETLRDEEVELIGRFGQDPHQPDMINLTEHAMNASRVVNAVARKHGEVTRAQFPRHKDRILSITNGVHTPTWISAPVAALFDTYPKEIGDWRKDPERLKGVLNLRDDRVFRRALWAAHQENKKGLCERLKPWKMDPDVLTICWARRIAGNTRPSLIFQDIRRLVSIAENTGPLQIVFAGKAHPQDNLGSTHIHQMLAAVDALASQRSRLRVLMLENYDTYFGKMLASSVDVWLNNPLPPFEASGTSGMKAILNGVVQLSTLDGWVVEAEQADIGWIFGWRHKGGEIGDEGNQRLAEDSASLYDALEKVVSLYYRTNGKNGADPSSEWITKMINAVSQAGFFNTGRMVSEY